MNKSVFCLASLIFVSTTETLMLTGIIHEISQTLNISNASAGQLTTVLIFTRAIFAPFSSFKLSRFNPKKVLLSICALCAAINVLLSFTESFFGLLVLRLIIGITSAPAFPIAISLAPQISNQGSEGKSVSAINSGITFSFILALPIGTIIGSKLGLNYLFLLVSSSYIAVLLLTLFLLDIPRNETDPKIDKNGTKKINKRVIPIILAQFMFWCGWFVFIVYSAPLLKKVIDASPEVISSAQLVSGIGMMIGNYIGGKVANRKTADILISGFMLSTAFTLAFLPIAFIFLKANVVFLTLAIFLAIFICSALSMAFLPSMFILFLSDSQSNKAFTVSLANTSGLLGRSAGSAAGGFFIANFAVEYLTLFSSMIIFLTGVLTLFFWTRNQEHEETRKI